MYYTILIIISCIIGLSFSMVFMKRYIADPLISKHEDCGPFAYFNLKQTFLSALYLSIIIVSFFSIIIFWITLGNVLGEVVT